MFIAGLPAQVRFSPIWYTGAGIGFRADLG